jgi:hypothetical protein
LGYYIYRSDGNTVGPPPFYQVQVGPATQPDGQTVTYLDETVGNNKPYTYFVVAIYDVEVANADGTSSHTTEVGGASNAFPILAK